MVFVAVLALLLLIGLPMSVFCVLTGAKFGLAQGLLPIAVAMWLQLSCYWLVHSHCAAPLQRWLARRDLPRLEPSSPQAHYYALALVALPVLPYMVKNLLVAAGAFRYPGYLLLTWPLQMLYSLPFVSATEALASASSTTCGCHCWHCCWPWRWASGGAGSPVAATIEWRGLRG